MPNPKPPTPYFLFRGTAREALRFYADVFGGSVELHTFGDFNRTDGPADAIAHGYLVEGPVALFAADVARDEKSFRSEALMLSLLGAASPSALADWFSRLSDGGNVVDDLQARPWGASDGQVIDRYGVHWLIGFEEGATDTTPDESERNKAIMAAFWRDAFPHIDDAVERTFAADWIDHDAGPSQPAGAEGFKWTLRRLKAGFADARHLPMELIADGDKVVAPWTIEGTHTGTFAGLEPTGRRIRVSGIQIDRLRDGKVVESWNHSSDTGIVAQLKSKT